MTNRSILQLVKLQAIATASGKLAQADRKISQVATVEAIEYVAQEITSHMGSGSPLNDALHIARKTLDLQAMDAFQTFLTETDELSDVPSILNSVNKVTSRVFACGFARAMGAGATRINHLERAASLLRSGLNVASLLACATGVARLAGSPDVLSGATELDIAREEIARLNALIADYKSALARAMHGGHEQAVAPVQKARRKVAA